MYFDFTAVKAVKNKKVRYAKTLVLLTFALTLVECYLCLLILLNQKLDEVVFATLFAEQTKHKYVKAAKAKSKIKYYLSHLKELEHQGLNSKKLTQVCLLHFFRFTKLLRTQKQKPFDFSYFLVLIHQTNEYNQPLCAKNIQKQNKNTKK